MTWATRGWAVGRPDRVPLAHQAQILIFFAEAGPFAFGSGLAIAPFPHQGVVKTSGWPTGHQLLVAVATITPGPIVITVAFMGHQVAGRPGAVLAVVGIFPPEGPVSRRSVATPASFAQSVPS